MLNPSTAYIEVNPPENVEQFKLRYRSAGSIVAEQVGAANHTTGNIFLQSLAALNAAVPAENQGSSLSLSAIAVNSGGESAEIAAAEDITVENPPATPTVVVAQA